MTETDSTPEPTAQHEEDVRRQASARPTRKLSSEELSRLASKILSRADPHSAIVRAFKDHPDFEPNAVQGFDPDELQA